MDQHTIIDVHVLLVRDGDVLLTQRRGAYGGGMWHLPSGKLDAGESLLAAAAREAEEEVGVTVALDSLRHVHTAHVADSGPVPRLGIFFEATEWQGEPTNREPDKCADVAWFSINELPPDVIPYPLAGILAYRNGVTFSAFGWNEAEPLVPVPV